MSFDSNQTPLTHSDWGACLDVPLQELSKSDCEDLGVLAARELVVVVPSQFMTTDDEVRVCNDIGRVEQLPSEIFHRCPPKGKAGCYEIIQRVTGELDGEGRPKGLFYHNEELDWHVNRASNFSLRKPLVWLRAIHGVEGSRTSWINCCKAFEDLSEDRKEELRQMKGIFGYEPGKYSAVTDFLSHRNPNPFPLIYVNPLTQKEALYFPFNQIFEVEGLLEKDFLLLCKELREHLTKKDYIYHHDWKPGDVVLSDQWSTLHKRWAFDVSSRLLHRVTMEYRGYSPPV